MPEVSVVIPCYNSERFIEDTLESVLTQTFCDFELICVDNASTDSTPELLAKASEKDPRIRLIYEETPGEGPARNAGFTAATGTWLYFLDADDLMEPRLLERTLERGKDTDADLVIFKTRYLDDQTGEIKACPECMDVGWIKTWDSPGVFSPRNNPEQLFTSFQNWVHNKLFRASFLYKHNIEIQHVHRMADILFTCRALSEANRIALLDEALHLYRVNNPNSAIFTADSYPLDFYTAFLELRKALETNNTWQLFHDSYVNWAEEAVAMNLYRCRSLEGFCTIANTMKEEGLQRLDILNFPKERAYSLLRHQTCMKIASSTLDELLFYYFYLERRHLEDTKTELSKTSLELLRYKTSTSYKLGNKLVGPAARLRDALHKK